MLTGTLKNKVDSIWEMFWTGGITNPLDVVEQMTYLMFIHDLDETDAKKAKSSMMLELPYTSMFEGHDEYKWSCFRDYPAERRYSRSSRTCIVARKVHTPSICPMRFSKFPLRSCSQRL